jgi:hypothetical protein
VRTVSVRVTVIHAILGAILALAVMLLIKACTG